MLSRIADSLFWLSRYMERSDALLRISYVHYILSLDKDVNGNLSWQPVLELFVTVNPEELSVIQNDTGRVLNKMLCDTTNFNSLKTLVHKARENARGAQDHITKEVWEEVNGIYHLVNSPTLIWQLNEHQGLEVIELFRKHSVLYTGLIESTMSRGVGWQFMNLGKYMERCLQTLVITEKQLEGIDIEGELNDILQWRYLLLSLSGYELHLKSYRSSNYNQNLLHQIILNENFTRSILYSLSHINFYLKKVTGHDPDEEATTLIRDFGRLYSKVKYADVQSLDNKTLVPFLNEVKSDVLSFGQQLAQHFFSYS